MGEVPVIEMGQALQKLRGGSGGGAAAALRRAPPPQHHANNTNIDTAVRPPPSQPPQPVPRQSVEVRPQAPEPQPIIEPGMPIPGEWNRGDPRYSAMVQQVVGKISTRPGGTQEMGNAQVTAEFRRPRPSNRRTSAATGPDEEKVVAAGTLNIAGIQEALRLFQGIRAEGEKVQEKPMDVKSLAEKFNVNVVLLERVLKYTSLPEPSRKQKFRN